MRRAERVVVGSFNSRAKPVVDLRDFGRVVVLRDLAVVVRDSEFVRRVEVARPPDFVVRWRVEVAFPPDVVVRGELVLLRRRAVVVDFLVEAPCPRVPVVFCVVERVLVVVRLLGDVRLVVVWRPVVEPVARLDELDVLGCRPVVRRPELELRIWVVRLPRLRIRLELLGIIDSLVRALDL